MTGKSGEGSLLMIDTKMDLITVDLQRRNTFLYLQNIVKISYVLSSKLKWQKFRVWKSVVFKTIKYTENQTNRLFLYSVAIIFLNQNDVIFASTINTRAYLPTLFNISCYCVSLMVAVLYIIFLYVLVSEHSDISVSSININHCILTGSFIISVNGYHYM